MNTSFPGQETSEIYARGVKFILKKLEREERMTYTAAAFSIAILPR